MVSHSLVLRGGATHTAVQVINGNQDIHCRHAVLTSVIVQLKAPAARLGALHGVSIKFPSQVCPPSATHHSGPGDESATQNRLDVHYSMDTATFFYKPNLIMHDMTFLASYEVTLYDIMNPTVKLSEDAMDDIYCITLNFSCAVDSLIMT